MGSNDVSSRPFGCTRGALLSLSNNDDGFRPTERPSTELTTGELLPAGCSLRPAAFGLLCDVLSPQSRLQERSTGLPGQGSSYMLDNPYLYEPLCGDEIRLIHLLPAKEHDAEICIRIVHRTLTLSEDDKNGPPSRAEVEATLPPEWEVEFETPEGDWIYNRKDETSSYTYDHPLGREVAVRGDLAQSENDSVQHPYEALSYSWGDRSQRKVLHIVPGAPSSAAFHSLGVTENLDVALRHLRHYSEERVLWIDAICINQGDIPERNTQVLRMRLIYSGARRVVVWLGAESSDSTHALDTLRYLGRQVEISVDCWRFQARDATETAWHSATTPLPYGQADWAAVGSLLNRSWFSRLWTLQEIAVARQRAAIFQCGHASILWSHLRRAIVSLSVKEGAPPSLMASAKARQLVAYGNKPQALSNVLPLSRALHCEDARDHVYGISSFYGPRLRNRIARPDYHRPVEEVYKDVFLCCSEVTHRLDLLAYACDDTEPECASWVVSWRSRPASQGLPEGYQASGVSRAHFSCPSAEILEARGMVLTTIRSVNKEKYGQGDSRLAAKLRGINFQDMTQDRYVSGETLESAWARTIIGDNCMERNPESDSVDLDRMKAMIADLRDRPDSQDAEDSFQAMQTVREVISNQTHSRIFHCEDGYIGFGSEGMREGDGICVLLGLFCPLVVRRTAEGAFRIVGWAYVHGFMGGEAFLGPLPPGWRVIYKSEQRTQDRAWYIESATGHEQIDDPRLGSLPSGWRRRDFGVTSDDPQVVDCFENAATGEVINHDPRMSLEMLEERGVELEVLRFV